MSNVEIFDESDNNPFDVDQYIGKVVVARMYFWRHKIDLKLLCYLHVFLLKELKLGNFLCHEKLLSAKLHSISFSHTVLNLLQKGLHGEAAPLRNLPSIHKFYSMNLPTIFKVSRNTSKQRLKSILGHSSLS